MITALVLVIVVLTALAATLGALLSARARDTARLHEEKREAEAARDAALEEVRVLAGERARVEAELAALRASSTAETEALRRKNAEQSAAEAAEREKLQETFHLQFKELATEILGEQTRRFTQTSSESLDLVLKPFRDNITEFRKRVEDIYTSQTSQRGELKAELKNLMELNQRITTETTNLTNALKGNSKVQGDWGEMLLETILESSTLTKGIHFETQYNVKDAEGRNLRPDVVLHLPGGKQIVIDSKVSLTAYVGYSSSEEPDERRRLLAAHVASVRQHVAELGRKEYQRQLSSPDFVIMFVPNEPAFLTALQHDPAIWSDAYERKVIVSSPTNLFALLKLVADLWKYDDQQKNAEEINERCLKLYTKLSNFVDSLRDVGIALDKARAAYDTAEKRLYSGKGSICGMGEQLRRRASLQPKKTLPAPLSETTVFDDAEDDDRLLAGTGPEDDSRPLAGPQGAAPEETAASDNDAKDDDRLLAGPEYTSQDESGSPDEPPQRPAEP